jgi:hypothetical protein
VFLNVELSHGRKVYGYHERIRPSRLPGVQDGESVVRHLL